MHRAGTSPSHRVIAHLPLLLHPNPKRALVVGFGMGLTSHSITQHGVQVDAIELSKGVINASQKHFKHINENIFDNRLFNYKLNDGRNHILMTQTKYDMISTGIIHPLVSAGSSNIYTEDFYKLCKRILTEDGVMCQWVPLHRLPESHYKMIVRTFIRVFPETTLWYKYTPDFVILIGTKDPLTIDYNDFMRRTMIPSIRDGLAADDLDGMSLLDSFMMGPKAVQEYVKENASDGPLHTDDRPRLEFFKASELTTSTAANIIGMKKYRQRITPPFLTNYGTTHTERRAVQDNIDTYFKATQQLIRGQIDYAEAQTELAKGSVNNFNAKLQSASAIMLQALRINPEDQTISYNYGVVSGIIQEDDRERFRQIEKQTQQTLQENPDDIQSHIQLGVVYEDMARENEGKGDIVNARKELAKATKEFEKALQLDPNRLAVYLMLGPIYQRQQMHKEALRTYKRLEQQDPNLPAPIFAAMAQLHWKLENVEDARRYAQKGLDTDRNSWRSHHVLGKVYHSMNQQDKLHEHYFNALKIIEAEIILTSDPSNLLSYKEEIQNELDQIQK